MRSRQPLGRLESVGWCALAYAGALAVAVAIPSYLNVSAFATLLASIVAAAITVFGFSVAFDDASFSDLLWGLAPPAVAAFWLDRGLADGADPWRPWLYTYLVCLWSVRLTYHRLRAWPGIGREDWRHAQLRRRGGPAYWPLSFLVAHLFPALLVFVATLPLQAIMVSDHPLGILDAVIALTVAGAIGLEGAADHQLFHFRRQTEGHRDTLDHGLWSYSRHPNYFAETAFWFALWLGATNAQFGAWWTIVGPLMVLTHFWLVTIPRTEAHLAKARPTYRARTRSVSGFVPWPKDGGDA